MNESELPHSYRWCYRLARDSGSSFYRSFWLLGRPARQAMFALYAFSRITDDLGDGPEPPSLKRQWLQAWRQTLHEQLKQHERLTQREQLSEVPASIQAAEVSRESLAIYASLWPALGDAVQRFAIPVSLLEDIITGVELDLEPVRMADWPELDTYCYHVASAVGLACTHIWQAHPTLPREAAIDCGLAFQLTNILRDLREDAQRSRIYLPSCEFQRYKVEDADWLAGRPSGDWQAMVAATVERTKRLYASGWRTIDHLPRQGRKMFSLMWHSYYRLLCSVENNVEHLWSDARISVPRGERVRLFAAHFLPLGTQLLSTKQLLRTNRQQS